MSAGGGGVSGVRIIMDLSIVSNLDTKMILPTQCGAHHNGYWEELLGDTIFYGKRVQPNNEKVYQINNNQLQQAIE